MRVLRPMSCRAPTAPVLRVCDLSRSARKTVFGPRRGPDLDRIREKTTGAYLRRWLPDLVALAPDLKMPRVPLTGEDLDALMAFLMPQRGRQALPEAGRRDAIRGKALYGSSECGCCHWLVGESDHRVPARDSPIRKPEGGVGGSAGAGHGRSTGFKIWIWIKNIPEYFRPHDLLKGFQNYLMAFFPYPHSVLFNRNALGKRTGYERPF